jgi:hypothetical protein
MSRATIARLYGILFAVSTAFPVAASLMPAEAVTRTIGVLDVAVAFVLLAFGISIVSVNSPVTPGVNARAVAWYRVSGIVPIVLLAVFFVAASRVEWPVLLMGLAWRAWLFYYTLPAALAFLQSDVRPVTR